MQPNKATRSASANGRAENIGIHPIVITELKLRNVQRHIFFADLVERADNAALEDRPKTFNRIRVDCADDVLALVVIDAAAWIFGVQFVVAAPSIGRKQADFVRNNFAHKAGSGFRSNTFENASDNVALALDRTNDWRLASGSPATSPALFIPMAIVILAADIGFINLDNATKFLLRLDHGRADFVAHTVRRAVGTETKLPLDLERANSFLAGRHQVDDLEPVAERFVCIFKDRSGDDREAIACRAARSALCALPVPLTRMQVVDAGIAATRTDDALRPAAGLQVGFASVVVTEWEPCLKFPLRHLVNWLRTFCHGGYPVSPNVEGYCHG
jgi:hypothetical protein